MAYKIKDKIIDEVIDYYWAGKNATDISTIIKLKYKLTKEQVNLYMRELTNYILSEKEMFDDVDWENFPE